MERLAAWAIGLMLATAASCTSATEYGTVAGELRAEGGRAPGLDVLTTGLVSVWSGGEQLKVLEVDGEFEVELPAGNYRLTATFGNGIPCSEAGVTVVSGDTVDVVIVCSMR
jgi:hypothetical protein